MRGIKNGINFASAFGHRPQANRNEENIARFTIDIKSSTREQKCTRSILDPISVETKPAGKTDNCVKSVLRKQKKNKRTRYNNGEFDPGSG